MPARFSLLFSVTTNPGSLATAAPHSGGWSESHWSTTVTNPLPYFQQLAALRAQLMPTEVSITGWRYQSYTITGNKILPGGSTTGQFLFPGVFSNDMNLPQDSLMESAATSGAPNATRFALRGIPDSQITLGEYQPTLPFSTALNNYNAGLINAVYGFIGRVKTGLSARVMSIAAGGVVTLNGPVGGVANQDFLRLSRVYDINGLPIKGSFAITNIAGNVYTCPSIGTQTATVPSGLARIDALALYSYSSINPARAVSRKIGRPFQQYRGRRSRLRAG